ncbi:MAG: hypothetical protein MUE30_08065 [Spirosomaceae bacterium]|nr:hypothetical protein [Spirosomataceae bacterium]
MNEKYVTWLVLLLCLGALGWRWLREKSNPQKPAQETLPFDDAPTLIKRIAALNLAQTPIYQCDKARIEMSFYGNRRSLDSLCISLSTHALADTSLATAHYFQTIEYVFFALRIYDVPNLIHQLTTQPLPPTRTYNYLISSEISNKSRKVVVR